MNLYAIIKITRAQYAVVLQSDHTKVQFRSTSRIFCREWLEANTEEFV